MQKKILLSAVLAFCFFTAATLGKSIDYYGPYLNDNPPKIVEVVSKAVEDGVEVTKLKFESRTDVETNEPAIIYGILTRPTDGKKHPGILLTHGGGGSAEEQKPFAIGWAKRGYIAFCQDQPGFYNAGKGKSTGAWLRGGRDIIQFKKDVRECSLFDGVAAALNGLRMLRSQSDADKNRIGVTGGSWGGYMSTIVTGISGNRVNALFSVYGCGYYDIGSYWTPEIEALPKEKREIWLKVLDPGRWASNIKARYFVISPANDWYFWPNAVMATYNDVKGEKNLTFSPNDSHDLRVPGGMNGPQKIDYNANRTYMEIPWMNYYLKGEGKPFDKCAIGDKPKRAGDSVKVSFKVKGEVPIKEGQVWYSYGEMPWRDRLWKKAEVKKEGKDIYTALIPVYETMYPMSWFGIAIDERDITVGTTMQKFEPMSLGFKASERRDLLFNEDFEQPKYHERWKKPYPLNEIYNNASMSICSEAAHDGKYGLMMKGKGNLAVRCDGIRGVMLKNSGSKGVSFWAKSPGGTGFEVVMMAEEPNGVLKFWKAAVENPGNEWKKITVTWDKFVYSGDKAPNFMMLSEHLGQFRFHTPADAEIYFDDIATVK